MDKVCMLCKYPPIQGGESSKAYWLLRSLGSRGHEMHVVTNAMEVEDEYRERLDGEDLDEYIPAGVRLHNSDPFLNPHFIPYFNPFTEKLAGLAIDTIRANDLEIIDTWYVMPYGISGLLAKHATGRPLIVRHAGSDISRLFSSPYLRTLFVELFRQADRVVTYPGYREFFIELGVEEQRIFINRNVSVDTGAFNSGVTPLDISRLTSKYRRGLPIVTFLGKLHPTKGIYELIHALEIIDKDFLFVVVTGGSDLLSFQRHLDASRLANKTLILGFLPPWRIPGLLRASTCVVCPERDFPVAAHSPILPREVMAVGTCLVISRELYLKRRYEKALEGDSLLVVDPKQIQEFAHTLNWVIGNPEGARFMGLKACRIAEGTENFGAYLEDMERLYAQIRK